MRQNSMLAKKNNKSLWTTVAVLGAAMAMFLPHAARAEGANAAADKVTAELNLRQITGNKPVTASLPAPTIVVNAPVATTAVPEQTPQANQKLIPNTALYAMAQATDPLNPLAMMPSRVNKLGLIVVGSSAVNRITAGSLDGSLKDADGSTMIAEDILVANWESSLNPQAVAPAKAFKIAFNLADRPAGAVQLTGVAFATQLAVHMEDIKPRLTEAEQKAMAPTFAVLSDIGNAYARRRGLDADIVMRSPYLFGQAYKSASYQQLQAVRRARVDMTSVEQENGTTTRGILLSLTARRFKRDDAKPLPRQIADRINSGLDKAEHDLVTSAAGGYLAWVLGDGGANQVINGNMRSQANALRYNPSVGRGRKNAAGILQGLANNQFRNLPSLRNVVTTYIEDVAAPIRAELTPPKFVLPIPSF